MPIALVLPSFPFIYCQIYCQRCERFDDVPVDGEAGLMHGVDRLLAVNLRRLRQYSPHRRPFDPLHLDASATTDLQLLETARELGLPIVTSNSALKRQVAGNPDLRQRYASVRILVPNEDFSTVAELKALLK